MGLLVVLRCGSSGRPWGCSEILRDTLGVLACSWDVLARLGRLLGGSWTGPWRFLVKDQVRQTARALTFQRPLFFAALAELFEVVRLLCSSFSFSSCLSSILVCTNTKVVSSTCFSTFRSVSPWRNAAPGVSLGSLGDSLGVPKGVLLEFLQGAVRQTVPQDTYETSTRTLQRSVLPFVFRTVLSLLFRVLFCVSEQDTYVCYNSFTNVFTDASWLCAARTSAERSAAQRQLGSD